MTNTQGSDTESTRDEVREQLYIAFQRLDDIETTIADVTPEELPQLHSKLEALSTRLTADIEQALATYLEQQIAEATQLIHGRHSIECDKCYDDLGLTKDNNKE